MYLGRKMDDFNLEVKRQLFHLILGVCISITVWILMPVWWTLVLIPLIAAILVLLLAPKIAPHFGISKSLIFHFERTHDAINFPFKGAIFYGIGIIPPIMLLPVDLACIVILILSVGDSISTLSGKFCGRHKIGRRSVEGSLGFILSSMIACIAFIRLVDAAELTSTAIFLVFAGALIELQEFVDDNFAVPAGLAVVLKFLGY